MRGGWEEFPRSQLVFFTRFYVQHRDARLFRRKRGEVTGDPRQAIAGFYVDENGDACFLEEPAGPKTVAELDERKARRGRVAAPATGRARAARKGVRR